MSTIQLSEEGRICAALEYVPADDRDQWCRIGMSLQSEFGDAGFDIWDAWSQRSERYNERDARSVWKSFKGGGITIATLFKVAREHGYSDRTPHKPLDPQEKARRDSARQAERERQAAEDYARHAKAAARAQRIWNEAEPANGHGYLRRKGVQAHDLKVGRWEKFDSETGEVRVVSEEALLVPIRDAAKRIHSLQAIFPSNDNWLGRDRDYLTGGAKEGNFFTIGKPLTVDGKKIIVICTGYATSASVHEASGHAVVVAFDDSNLLAVAKVIRKRYPDADIIVFSDRDAEALGESGGTRAALKAALATSARVVVPEWTGKKGRDANDIHREGFEWHGTTYPGKDILDACVKFATPCRSPAFMEMLRQCGIRADDLASQPVAAEPVAVPEGEAASAADQANWGQVECTGDNAVARARDAIDTALLQNLTQDSAALVFRRRFHGRLLFAHSYGSWLEWDGTRWKREQTELAFDYARDLAREMNVEGKNTPATASFCRGVEAFARADRAFAVQGGEFDADNYLLNTPVGTYDLRTNVLRQHDQIDRITKSTAVAPSEKGGERFLQFLNEITEGDDSLVRFLQVSLGSCLSGAIESHWMLFWTGSGRNGKNTLGDLVMHVMGDYAKKIPSSTLMAKSHEAHPTEIASLQGARLVVSSEVADGDHWNEARINELTGDETLSARFMRGDFFDFRRTHKHLVFGNHRPQLRTSTDALRSRIKIVPFKQSFVGREDAELPARLRDEAGFVLYWLLEGHSAWLDAGRKLPICDAIEAESRDYFDSQSTVEAWVQERIADIGDDGRAASSWLKAGELFVDYREWKLARGEQPVSQTRWGETMAKLFRKVRVDGIRYVGAVFRSRY
ncbi:phage/plasmid primase, P4 family [Ralstonia nicotianae]